MSPAIPPQSLPCANELPPLRVIFAGTPEFALKALELLHSSEPRRAIVVGVLSQPDRPAGRGMKLQASVVKQFAIDSQIPCSQPRSLRLDGKYPEDAVAAQKFIIDLKPDVIIVAAYGLILPNWVLQSAPLGCLNIHASLLPRWRGAAPIHRAIEAGDLKTGICIMQMDQGLDTGPILMSQELEIEPFETTASMHDKLATCGALLLLETLTRISSLKPIAQSTDGIIYAHKIEKAETWIDWSKSSIQIERKLRAFTPAPGLQSSLNGETLKIWSAISLNDVITLDTDPKSRPGSIVKISSNSIDVLTGDGLLRITELQKAGAKRLAVSSFIQGSPIPQGSCFESGSRQFS